MTDFLKILPFILGAAISPVLLVTALYVLSRPKEPVKKNLVYLLGGAITVSIISTIIFYTTQIRPTPAPRNDLIPHLIIGLLLLFLAFDIYHKGPAKSQHQSKKGQNLFTYFGLGVILMITNFTTIAMIFEVALGLRQYGINGADKVWYLIATIFSSLIPIILPLFVLLLAGKNSEKILDNLSGFMKKYSHIVTSLFFALVGLFVLLKPFIG